MSGNPTSHMIHKPINHALMIALHAKGYSARHIAKLLKVSRNSVAKALSEQAPQMQAMDKPPDELANLISQLFTRCQGNVVRIQELLASEYQHDIAYSSLTRWVRQYQLRQPVKRAGCYHFEPGQEMQHDTSPHKLALGDKVMTAQCAALVLAYSRTLYMQYYPCFTRFEAKNFLSQALRFMGGSGQRCVVDNTSVILCAGSGSDAVIAPDIAAFARVFGFEFIAHAIGHADRKARVERPFHYIEHNFLAGRTFTDWHDLNQQALAWCEQVANRKEKRALGMSPEAAYVHEKPHLIPLPGVMPPVYSHTQRIVDTSAFINLDTISYSVPQQLIGQRLDVYKYLETVEIFNQNKRVVTHPRLLGVRYQRCIIKSHHLHLYKSNRRQASCESEQCLRNLQNAQLTPYLDALKKRVRGRGMHRFNQLLNLQRTYPQQAFMAAVAKAQHYGLYDLYRLENMIIQYVSEHYFNLNLENY